MIGCKESCDKINFLERKKKADMDIVFFFGYKSSSVFTDVQEDICSCFCTFLLFLNARHCSFHLGYLHTCKSDLAGSEIRFKTGLLKRCHVCRRINAICRGMYSPKDEKNGSHMVLFMAACKGELILPVYVFYNFFLALQNV